MARFKTHALIGGGVGFAAYCVKYNVKKTFDPETKFDWPEASAWIGAGVLGACLPDWLEPATTPNHRAFFHSFVVLAALLWYLMLIGAGTLSTVGLLAVASLGYISHLVVDSLSPRSLPWFK